MASDQRVWWSPTNGRRTTPFFVPWEHGALSPANAKELARAEHRSRRRERSGAAGAVRAAALKLASPDGQATMSRTQLLDQVLGEHPAYSRVSVRDAIDDHARDADGVLTRLQVGLFRLRLPADRPGAGKRVARDWVLDALGALTDRVDRPVTRREVEHELATMGLRYSERAVNKGLTDLVRDPGARVTMTADHRYRLAR